MVIRNGPAKNRIVAIAIGMGIPSRYGRSLPIRVRVLSTIVPISGSLTVSQIPSINSMVATIFGSILKMLT